MSSSYWKYDELNDLRMKFISLLGNNSSEDKNTNLCSNDSNNESRVCSPTQVLLSLDEKQQIESFYKSFGTSLFVSNTSACLYTVNNGVKKTPTESNTMQKNANRSSVASVKQLSSANEIEQDKLIKDLILNNGNSTNLSVSHCGIPLWLCNTRHLYFSF